MREASEKEYRAIIWTNDPPRPGKRVSIWATDLEQARRQIEEQYGEGTVFDLHNEEEANSSR